MNVLYSQWRKMQYKDKFVKKKSGVTVQQLNWSALLVAHQIAEDLHCGRAWPLYASMFHSRLLQKYKPVNCLVEVAYRTYGQCVLKYMMKISFRYASDKIWIPIEESLVNIDVCHPRTGESIELSGYFNDCGKMFALNVESQTIWRNDMFEILGE